MDLQTYMQLAPRTYTGEKLEILTLGFMGEPGELIDLLKKESRGKEITREMWINELADAFWYAVVWCHVHDRDFEAIYHRAIQSKPAYGSRAFRGWLRQMCYHGICLDEMDEFGYFSYAAAEWQLECYLTCWEHIRGPMGFTLEELFDYNIKKLAERYAHLFEKEAAE